MTLNLRGQLLEPGKPMVMGILNITPDSFHAPSRAEDAEEAAERVGEMLAKGADIIDIGACSTRPGSKQPSAGEEMRRLTGPLEQIRKKFPEAILSVDTYRASVARAVLENGLADIINDVSGGDMEMYDIIASHGAAYVLMHMRGTPADMDSRCQYGDVVADVTMELAFKVDRAREAGICNLIVDPGFGFAKTVEQNFELLHGLDRLQILDAPILAGMSRKRMARALAGGDEDRILEATLRLNAIALRKGAAILRVHDVAEASALVKRYVDGSLGKDDLEENEVI